VRGISILGIICFPKSEFENGGASCGKIIDKQSLMTDYFSATAQAIYNPTKVRDGLKMPGVMYFWASIETKQGTSDAKHIKLGK
jgi:hypothetical protein